MKNFFKNVTNVIEEFNITIAKINNAYENEKELEILDKVDFDLAKALVLDWEDVAVRVAKMILAHKDINDIKVKVE